MSDSTYAGPAVTPNDVFITRAFDAPVARVWKFWTEPEFIAQWFGPTGIHVDVASVKIELEVGGSWSLVMTDDATGAQFPIDGRITALRPGEYLEVQSDALAQDGPMEDIMMRITFHDHGDRTRVTLHQGPFTEEQRSQTATGWEMSFVKLDGIFAGGAA
ncbi:MAG: hypothetical protein JWN36_2754 [Microbacteriaceae bacterium]|nr:hypothetical protein [Microbacteriaceae bacterium]